MKLQKILKITLPLALGGFLVWYSLTIVSPEKLITYFKNANYPWVLLGLIFGILSHISRAYRWKFLLEPMGFKPKFVNSFLAVLVAYLVNLILPRAGEISRAAIMANYEKIPFEKGFGIGSTMTIKMRATTRVALYNKSGEKVFAFYENERSKKTGVMVGGVPVVKPEKILPMCESALEELMGDLRKRIAKIVKKSEVKL